MTTAPICAAAASPRSSQSRPIRYDRTAHRRRNIIQRPFIQLTSWRGIASRHDEHAAVFRGAVVLASILI